LDIDLAESPSVCVAAAETLLSELLAHRSKGRDVALDLLAADALMTYAFEIAASDLPGLDRLARDTVRRLATTSRE
jgi:hypothetical protein